MNLQEAIKRCREGMAIDRYGQEEYEKRKAAERERLEALRASKETSYA